MADTSESYSNGSANSIAISNYNNIESKGGLTDEDFMAVIKNFPAVYDRRSEAFKDKTFKEEAWEKISEYFDMRIEDVKRRYDTIRTRLSRYLKKAKEGYWVNDTNNIDSKIDFMSWLIPHIKTRESSLLNDNMRRDILMNNNAVGESPASDNSAGNEKRTEQSFFNGGDTLAGETADDRISMIQIAETSSSRRSVTSHDSDEQRDEKPPMITLLERRAGNNDLVTIAAAGGKRNYNMLINTRKEYSDEDDCRRNGRENRYVSSNCSEPSPMTSRPVRVATTSTNPSSRQYIDLTYDEDEHYCKSLVGRFKRLDSKHKAYLRSTIEKTFLDFELGYVQFPRQQPNETKHHGTHHSQA